MSDLLEKAINGHGGWDRWISLSRVIGKANISGSIWQVKGKAGVLDSVTFRAELHRQHLEYSPFGKGRHSIYEPSRTSLVADDGAIESVRENPRGAFDGHSMSTPWDDHHLAYFSGYALWTYITTPFLFRLPGVETEEIDPWIENGETWRRLKVTFPTSIHAHCSQQVFYFNDAGILQRQDYSVDIMGGVAGAHYTAEPKLFDGIVVPTRRRVYFRDSENKPILNDLCVSIDIHDFKFE
jgi:hypothetical protein